MLKWVGGVVNYYGGRRVNVFFRKVLCKQLRFDLSRALSGTRRKE